MRGKAGQTAGNGAEQAIENLTRADFWKVLRTQPRFFARKVGGFLTCGTGKIKQGRKILRPCITINPPFPS